MEDVKLCARCGGPNTRKHAYCKTCGLEYSMAWREAHPGRQSEINNAWNKRHPDVIKAAQERFRAAHPYVPRMGGKTRAAVNAAIDEWLEGGNPQWPDEAA